MGKPRQASPPAGRIAAAAFCAFLGAGSNPGPVRAAEPAQATPGPASLCAPRAEIAGKLAGADIGEVLTGAGLTAAGNVLEIWTAPGGRTWTALITRPDGITCLVVTGETWTVRDVPGGGAALRIFRGRDGREAGRPG